MVAVVVWVAARGEGEKRRSIGGSAGQVMVELLMVCSGGQVEAMMWVAGGGVPVGWPDTKKAVLKEVIGQALADSMTEEEWEVAAWRSRADGHRRPSGWLD